MAASDALDPPEKRSSCIEIDCGNRACGQFRPGYRVFVRLPLQMRHIASLWLSHRAPERWRIRTSSTRCPTRNPNEAG
jgi:hypothetical protein